MQQKLSSFVLGNLFLEGFIHTGFKRTPIDEVDIFDLNLIN